MPSPWPASDQSRTPVTSSPSTKTWATCRSPCMNTGVHGRSAASATSRLRVTRSAGRTSFARSHAHSLSRLDAFSSRLAPGPGRQRRVVQHAVGRHPPRPTPPPTRSTARRGGRAPSPGGRRARARAACATGPPGSGSAPSSSPRPRRRCASGRRRSSGTRRRRGVSRARGGPRRPRPRPRRSVSRTSHVAPTELSGAGRHVPRGTTPPAVVGLCRHRPGWHRS